MVAIQRNRRIRRPRQTWRDSIPGVHIATKLEGQRLFDYQAKKELGISGELFLERLDAGEYRAVSDPVTARKVERLLMLIPFARRTRG